MSYSNTISITIFANVSDDSGAPLPMQFIAAYIWQIRNLQSIYWYFIDKAICVSQFEHLNYFIFISIDPFFVVKAIHIVEYFPCVRERCSICCSILFVTWNRMGHSRMEAKAIFRVERSLTISKIEIEPRVTRIFNFLKVSFIRNINAKWLELIHVWRENRKPIKMIASIFSLKPENKCSEEDQWHVFGCYFEFDFINKILITCFFYVDCA